MAQDNYCKPSKPNYLLVNEWNVNDVTLCRMWSKVVIKTHFLLSANENGPADVNFWNTRDHCNLKITLCNSENGLSPNHIQINIRYLARIWSNTMLSLLVRLNGFENKIFFSNSFFLQCLQPLHPNKLTIKNNLIFILKSF